MKKLLLIFTLILTVVFAFEANSAPSPFGPKLWNYLQLLDGESKNQVKRILKESVTLTNVNASQGLAINLEGLIPSGAIITNAYAYLSTAAVSADGNDLQLGCDASGDVLAIASVSFLATGSFWGNGDNATSSFVYVDADCNPTITVGTSGSGYEAGVLEFTIEYQ